jgi:hypothetical protein
LSIDNVGLQPLKKALRTVGRVGGVPQSHNFPQPHFANHAKLAAMSDTFNIGVIAFTFIMRNDPLYQWN